MRPWPMAALFAALTLGGCATGLRPPPPVAVTGSPPPPYAAAPPAMSPPPSAPVSRRPPSPFDGLPGWAQDDHAAALAAFEASCPAARDPGLALACRRARESGRLDETASRAFLEANFRPEPAAAADGLLTAYFMPVYSASRRRTPEFTAPVRPRPADLPRADAAGANDAGYASRAAIDARPTGDALAWMRPEDLFFLQTQGCGVLVMDDGAALRAVFDGANGRSFVGIGGPMRARGLLAGGDASAEAIRGWLAAHRGPAAEAVMRLNPRYVFFRLTPDDGGEPSGAAGAPLIAGRALAVDPSLHAFGELMWIDATTPALAGAIPDYRRLAVALDAGGAIKGEARADLYLGRGAQAGREAGRVRHLLRLYRLAPVAPPS